MSLNGLHVTYLFMKEAMVFPDPMKAFIILCVFDLPFAQMDGCLSLVFADLNEPCQISRTHMLHRCNLIAIVGTGPGAKFFNDKGNITVTVLVSANVSWMLIIIPWKYMFVFDERFLPTFLYGKMMKVKSSAFVP